MNAEKFDEFTEAENMEMILNNKERIVRYIKSIARGQQTNEVYEESQSLNVNLFNNFSVRIPRILLNSAPMDLTYWAAYPKIKADVDDLKERNKALEWLAEEIVWLGVED